MSSMVVSSAAVLVDCNFQNSWQMEATAAIEAGFYGGVIHLIPLAI